MRGNISSDCVTMGIRVTARPSYQPQLSNPDEGQFVYAYLIRIANEGSRTVMLTARHWIIIDTDGNRETVDGPGVVGEQPVLEPGESFEYTSFCPLRSTFGTMEGTFELLDEQGAAFRVDIGRFYLVAVPDGEMAST